MNLTQQQLNQLAYDLQFLIGQKVKYDDELVTVVGIEVVSSENSLQLMLEEGLGHNVQLYMWLESFIEYNPKYAHLLPKE